MVLSSDSCAPYLCSGAGQPKGSIFGATFCSLTDTAPADELDAILDELEAADLVEQYVTEDGKAAMRLTEQGVRVGRSLALAGVEDAQTVLDALLDEAEG